MNVKQYRLLTDSTTEPKATKGTVVQKCRMHDYGCASDDTRITCVHHISLTLDVDGGYPFFTHPFKDLEEIKEAE
jgi:hypothetical protein